ncbi:MAG: 4'-phosphopantetheinyl transferase superfamily protein [Reichenbachiella sp.]|uniref:4'-phosphopantetheinyl transferase family protein n=1 Tax=Reichenbachiella sp. TaxID=2184521 RepID=UPI003264CC6C
MQIHWIKSNPDSTSIGLAEIEEQDESLLESSPELDALHPKKRKEFLASRALLKTMCEQLDIPYQGIRKDDFGKPHLIDSSYHISISHSYPMVACAIHPSRSCGIDIESARPQLLKIKHKFLNPQELAVCGDDLSKLCLHWAAKETLYKIHGRKKLIFTKELAVLSITSKEIKSQIILDTHTENYILKNEYFLEYSLVYSV